MLICSMQRQRPSAMQGDQAGGIGSEPGDMGLDQDSDVSAILGGLFISGPLRHVAMVCSDHTHTVAPG
jgi:hypothetical protein